MKKTRKRWVKGNTVSSLRSARWLGNNGVLVIYRGPTGTDTRRFEPPSGFLTIPETCKLLKIYDVMLYRLRDMGRLQVRRRGGLALVSVREALRIRGVWRRMGRRTARIPRPAARRKSAGGSPGRRREDRKLPAPLTLPNLARKTAS